MRFAWHFSFLTARLSSRRVAIIVCESMGNIPKAVRRISLYAISDLHLSFGVDKPMNIFKGWEHHTERLAAHWKKLVAPEDTVVLPGDFSWALKLEETEKDFAFLESLPGHKVLLKGNHDLWWCTKKKVVDFFEEKGFSSISLLYHDCVVREGFALAGTRGWFYDASDGDKVVLREAGRLEMSLQAAEKTGLPIRLFLHYPPVYGDMVCREIFDVIKRHGIRELWHGHIHGAGYHQAVSEFEGVKLHVISCDCMDFTPFLIT